MDGRLWFLTGAPSRAAKDAQAAITHALTAAASPSSVSAPLRLARPLASWPSSGGAAWRLALASGLAGSRSSRRPAGPVFGPGSCPGSEAAAVAPSSGQTGSLGMGVVGACRKAQELYL